MTLSLFVGLFAVLLYIGIGAAFVKRGMNHARRHALEDPQYMSLFVQRDRSLSMILPKVAYALCWPFVLLAVLVALAVTARDTRRLRGCTTA